MAQTLVRIVLAKRQRQMMRKQHAAAVKIQSCFRRWIIQTHYIMFMETNKAQIGPSIAVQAQVGST
jgi:hypothetical protein